MTVWAAMLRVEQHLPMTLARTTRPLGLLRAIAPEVVVHHVPARCVCVATRGALSEPALHPSFPVANWAGPGALQRDLDHGACV